MKLLRRLTSLMILVTAAQPAVATNLWSMARSSTLLNTKHFTIIDRVAGSTRSNQKVVVPDDLTSLITAPCGAKSKEHARAMELLELMQSAPTCNKLVTSSLLSSCQAIEGSTQGRESSLEGIKALYAAQLALCELRNVGAEPPEQCRSIALDVGTVAVDLHSAKFRTCLRSLESRPQWWTSYSNNVQNAVVMCRAARVEIEKGKSTWSQPRLLANVHL